MQSCSVYRQAIKNRASRAAESTIRNCSENSCSGVASITPPIFDVRQRQSPTKSIPRTEKISASWPRAPINRDLRESAGASEAHSYAPILNRRPNSPFPKIYLSKQKKPLIFENPPAISIRPPSLVHNKRAGVASPNYMRKQNVTTEARKGNARSKPSRNLAQQHQSRPLISALSTNRPTPPNPPQFRDANPANLLILFTGTPFVNGNPANPPPPSANRKPAATDSSPGVAKHPQKHLSPPRKRLSSHQLWEVVQNKAAPLPQTLRNNLRTLRNHPPTPTKPPKSPGLRALPVY